jgi:sugar transferase (PEP-CTERM/EpsH1 system associated)
MVSIGAPSAERDAVPGRRIRRSAVPDPGRATVMRPLRILFVVPYVPSRLRPRPLHFVLGLAERGHRVVLCAVAGAADGLDDDAALRRACEAIHIVRVSPARSLWNCAAAFATGEPMQAAYCMSADMGATIRAALSAAPACDVLHVEHLRAAAYGLEAPFRPRILDAVDRMSALHAQAAAQGPTWRSRLLARAELAPTRRYEERLVRDFDRVLVSADRERQGWAAPDGGAAIVTLANGVDPAHFAPRPDARQPATLVFAGRLAYHANQAAVRRLLESIMPGVWAARPETRLAIVGADPSARLRAWVRRAGPRVTLTGTVPDLRPFLARAAVSVNPLPYAVGIQNKLLEAMAMATPVVASPAAAAGLQAEAGRELLVEEEPGRFVAAVLHLLDDPSAAARIGAAGRRYVGDRHGWPQAAARLEMVYREAIEARARPRGCR